MALDLRNIGAVCAVLTTATFVAGIALMATSGVQTLIPETGAGALDWVAQVDGAGRPFLVGGWLVVAGGLLGLVALAGFYDVLRSAGPILVLAPVLAVAAMTLVTISHIVPLAMATGLVPGYVAADGATQVGLAPTIETFAALSLALNLAGDLVLWGVVVPMYAYATLKTRAIPRWIGWLGFVTAFFAGWLGVVGAIVPAVEGITFVGFVGFFVWMASMGVALLRRPTVTTPSGAMT